MVEHRWLFVSAKKTSRRRLLFITKTGQSYAKNCYWRQASSLEQLSLF